MAVAFRPARLILLVSLSLGTAGCASQQALVRQYQEMRPDLVQGHYEQAVQKIKEAKGSVYSQNDRVMYWLNLGTLLHYAGEHEQSMQVLIKAEEAMQELWTKSISAEVSRFVLNETTAAYAGEDYERVLIYLYTAANRLRQGRIQDALVEARRADERLRQMLLAYDKEDGLGSVYRQDAFMLWLVGLLYEMEGSFNDAYLTYRASARAYQEEYAKKFRCLVPGFLKEDMLRSARLAGLDEEAASVQQEYGASGETYHLMGEGYAELIVVHGNGEAPQKEEITFQALVPGGYYVRIALPEFVAREPSVVSARVRVGQAETQTLLAEPVTRIALAQYQAQLPAIRARAIARAALKFAASAGIREGTKQSSDAGVRAAGSILSLLTNVAAAASEAADLRAWTTLPSEFRVARMWVPAGEVELEIEYLDRTGSVHPRQAPIRRTITLGPGERRVLPIRSVL